MASLLVYVDPDRLSSLLGPRTVGRRVPIARAALPEQIERLDDTSTLFIVTLERGRALVVASVDEFLTGETLGDARIHDHDVSDMIFRLGCDKVWHVPQWASVPRVLPPGDVVLLRYTLGLQLDVADSIAERKEYAAKLEATGDPRGELIALQLGRTERGGNPSEREQARVAQVGPRLLGPLAVYLDSFAIERGVLARARIAEGTHVPDELCSDPVWRTVEEIATIDPRLLVSGALVNARIARLDGKALARIVHHDAPLRFDTLLPFAGTRGIALQFGNPRDWEELLAGTALPRLRAIAIDGTTVGARIAELLASPFAKRLAHLDVWTRAADVEHWRTAFDATELPLLTLRLGVDSIEPVIALERGNGPHQLTVELRATVSAAIARDLAPVVIAAGKGLRHVQIVDTSLAPFAAQQPDLLDALAPAFPAINLRRAPSLAL